MNLKEYDYSVYAYNQIINILEWDRDFTSSDKSGKSYNNLISNVKLAKHNYILNNFKKVNFEHSLAYFYHQKDFNFSFGIDSILEKSVEESLNILQKSYRKAFQMNRYDIIKTDFDNYIKLKRAEINSLPIKEGETYDKLLLYTCGESFSKTLKILINYIEELITSSINKYGYSSEIQLNPDVMFNDIRNLFDIYCVKQDGVVVQNDSFCSCLQLNKDDIRTTFSLINKYNECLHEIGHILYCQNIDEYNYKIYEKPSSRVMDEAIAILYELFINDKIKLDLRNLHYNEKRTECIDYLRIQHFILKYKLEKKLINGEISALNLAEITEKMFCQMFLRKPSSADYIILQDPHWFTGSFGIYPVYILSFILADLLYNKYIIKFKSNKEILLFLRNKILKFGSSVCDNDIIASLGLSDITNECLNLFKNIN